MAGMDPLDLFNGQRPPGEVLRHLSDTMGWSQEQLAAIIGYSRQTIIQVMGGKAGISPEMAIALGAAFPETQPADWLRLAATYRLASAQDKASDGVERRAEIYRKAPIRDMQRRGWIKDTADTSELEAEVLTFFEIASMKQEPTLSVATRRTVTGESLTPAQVAWCVQARRMATALQVKLFDSGQLPAALAELRALAAYPKEARHLPKALARYGIRFVVVEPLPGSKIDGAAFWLDKVSPVIAVSVRYDRIDHFWFTVLHEFFHICNGDALSIDTELVGESGARLSVAADESEERANREASSALIPNRELLSFMGRVGPLYSKTRIIQFAHKMKIHPGIIVGQLQHHGEIGYSAHREFLAKVRDAVIETALADGWGRSISPGSL